LKTGQVFLLDPRTGDKRIEPFQVGPENEVPFPRRVPAVTGENEVVLADGGTKLYHLAVREEPNPHLAELAQVEFSQPIVSPVAVLEELVFAVDAAGVLSVLQLPDLVRQENTEQTLTGRCVWGPERVGAHVLLATDEGRLLCLDGNAKLLWQIELPYGPLAGLPAEVEGHFILAAIGGVVWRVEAASGNELGKIDTGRPLGTGPVALGQQLLLGGHDGCLYLVEQPPAQ
jgi:hypothetical protein